MVAGPFTAKNGLHEELAIGNGGGVCNGAGSDIDEHTSFTGVKRVGGPEGVIRSRPGGCALATAAADAEAKA